ncbi:recombinase family protein [Anaerotignum sp.]|uniref:recombinase family protein n=1 Tax=Anaerotignum sp. TaxID=2039241 RepID=UPI003328999D
MARKSRKSLQYSEKEKKENLKYNTAIYARLSVEEEENQDSSIKNQILIATEYGRNKEDLNLVKIYIDNGKTGTNFKRPGFTCLMEDIAKGNIHCVIVKDLSRFGRNYLECGRLLETVFPNMGVRFISVTDHFDSLYSDDNDGLIISLKEILHDHYAKDISKKVSTALGVKKKKGKFLNRIPPYGYEISKEDKYQLVVCQEQAEVVRNIFRWRLEGMGSTAIARKLNDMGVPSYFKLRYLQGFADGKETALWRGSTIIGILKNPTYLGCLVERKTEKALYKGGRLRTLPQETWNLIQKTHEPIIAKGIFDQVQNKWKVEKSNPDSAVKNTSPKKKTENVFQGLLICGECGCVLQRNSGYYHEDGTLVSHYYYCPRKYIKEGACNAMPVSEKGLKEMAFEVCSKQLAFIKEEMEALEGELAEGKNKLEPHMKMVDVCQKKLGVTGEKKTEDSFCPKEWLEKLRFLENADGLTREVCELFFHRIIIKKNNYSFYFAYRGEWESLLEAENRKPLGEVSKVDRSGGDISAPF